MIKTSNFLYFICFLSCLLWTSTAVALDPVRIGDDYYPTLQAAYDDALDSNVIQSQTAAFCEDLYLDDINDKSVTLEGGYNSDFSAITGMTSLSGNMIISTGSVTIGDFVIQDNDQCLFGYKEILKLLGPGYTSKDYFGGSISANENYFIIGAPSISNYHEPGGWSGPGYAFIYKRTGPDSWDSGTRIAAPDGESYDRFGWSVSISDDYAIAGASIFNEFLSEGYAYIFNRIGPNTWDSGTKIIAPDGEVADRFGWSVSISGDYAIVGAPEEDEGGVNAGAAYIFRKTGLNTWDAGNKIMAFDAEEGDGFGLSVAISGDYAVVGAYQEDEGGTDAGAVYIFRRTGPDTWDTGTKIVPSGVGTNVKFGESVAISGDYAIAGAYGIGLAYIFQRTGLDTWDSGYKISWAGSKVAISGDKAIVGSTIFQRTGPNVWNSDTVIRSLDSQWYDRYGESVAISSDYAIIGAPKASQVGAAYVFQSCAQADPNPVTPEYISADAGNGRVTMSWYSSSCASSYNIYMSTDPGVSSSNYTESVNIASTSYTWAGLTNLSTYYFAISSVSDNGESDESTEILRTPISHYILNAKDGHSAAISGDYAIVGTAYDSEGGSNAGAAFIYERTGADSWDTGVKIMASDADSGDYFGKSVAMSGDYAIVGAPSEPYGPGAGAAYIYKRTGSNSWDSGTNIMPVDLAVRDAFGFSVAISGDYAIVGAYQEDEGGSNAGAAYIFQRTGPNTWDSGTKIMAADADAGEEFGKSVAISGNYAIVGAHLEDEGGSSAGAAYIFQRTGPNTWDSGTKIMAADAEANDWFGSSVAISGNYAVVGASQEDEGEYSAGAVYVFVRSGENSWDSVTKIIAPDAYASGWLGQSVAINDDYIVAVGRSAYIFNKTGPDTWDSGTKIYRPIHSDSQFNDSVVQISGDYFIMSTDQPGPAYVFRNSP